MHSLIISHSALQIRNTRCGLSLREGAPCGSVRGKMKRLLLSAVKTIVLMVALFCLLSFLGGFSNKQSVVLAILLFVAYSRSALSTTVPKFVPFNVFVTPNLYNILQDFELVKPTEEGWAEIRAGVETLSKEHWNIWHNRGFSVSFITRELIYNKDWQSFSTEEVDLSASLEPAVIVREQHKPDSMLRNYFPYLNLTGGRNNGLILRLTLLDWYWERVKDKEIPPEEFGVHFWVMPGNSLRDTESAYDDAVKRRTEARARYVWKGKAHRDMYDRATDADRSNEAEHRYCAVVHSGI